MPFGERDSGRWSPAASAIRLGLVAGSAPAVDNAVNPFPRCFHLVAAHE